MLKEAIQHLLNLAIKPSERIVDVIDPNGNNRTLVIDSEGISKEIKPVISRAEEALKINTLTGLIGYIKANLERTDSNFYLQVFDEKTVYLKGLGTNTSSAEATPVLMVTA